MSSHATQIAFHALPESGIVEVVFEHTAISAAKVLQLGIEVDELDALAWAVWFAFPASKEADHPKLSRIDQRLSAMRREFLTGALRFRGQQTVATRLSYPRSGAMVGTERNVENAKALMQAAEPLNVMLRKLAGE